MRGLAAVTAALLLSACGGAASPAAGTSPSPPATPRASASATIQPTIIIATATPTPVEAPSSTPTPPPAPAVATVSCPGTRAPGDPLALVSGPAGTSLLYDVAKPLEPHLFCRATDASLRFVSADEFDYFTAYSQGPVQVYRQRPPAAGTPAYLLNADGFIRDWRPDGSFSYTHHDPGASSDCCGSDQLHVVSAGVDHLVCSHAVGIVGIGPVRFFSSLLGKFSADARYFAQTTFAGKGGQTCDLIASSADGSLVASLPQGISDGLWSNATERLYLVTSTGVQTWEPGHGMAPLTAEAWVAPRLGPGGNQIAYTYYAKPDYNEVDLRVGVFDLRTGKPIAGLPDKPRSQAAFVTPTVLWYLEEGSCPLPQGCFTGDTAPTGRVLAFDTTTGAENPVFFAAGESPITYDDYQAFNVQLP